MLMRFDPFREFDRLAQDTWKPTRAGLPLDAYRSGDHVVVHVDVPGVDPASIDVTVERNVLTVKAERSWTPGEGDEVLVAERRQGEFTRRVRLGAAVDGEHIEARYEHGVLTLTLPLVQQAKARKVEVTTGAPAPVEPAAV
jgi:HSP20 family protein